MTQEDLKKPTNNQNQPLEIIMNGSHLDTLFATYGNTFHNKADSTLNKNINNLTNISISNAQILQSLLYDKQNSYDKIRVDINQSSANLLTSKTPIYLLKDTLNFPTFTIPSQYFDKLILRNNLDKTIYLYQRPTKDNLDALIFSNEIDFEEIKKGNLSINKIPFENGSDIILRNKFVNLNDYSETLFIMGFYNQKSGDDIKPKYFKLPILFEK
jgi:hypothetical protein